MSTVSGRWIFSGSIISGKVNLEKVSAIGYGMFEDAKISGEITFGSNIESIGSSAFKNSDIINGSIDCSNTTSIGYNAFSDSNIEILGDLSKAKDIGSEAFYNSKLQGDIDIRLAGTTPVWSTFRNTGITSIKMSPATALELSDTTGKYGAFSGCNSLKQIDISGPYKATYTIPWGAPNSEVTTTFSDGLVFKGKENITPPREPLGDWDVNPVWSWDAKSKYNLKVSTAGIATQVVASGFPSTMLTGEVTLPTSIDGIRIVTYSTLAFPNTVTGLLLPNDITYANSLITTAKAPGVTYVALLGKMKTVTNPFAANKTIKTIELGEMTTIPASMFKGNTALEAVVGLYVTTAGAYVFQGCTNLYYVDLPSLTATTSGMFNGCTALNDIALYGVETLKSGTFTNSGIVSLTLPVVKKIEVTAVSGCAGLTDIVLGPVQTIATTSFSNAKNIQNIYIERKSNIIKGAPWGAPATANIIWNGQS